MSIFVVFFEAQLVILGTIDFFFRFQLNRNVNDRQNKFEFDILKNVA